MNLQEFKAWFEGFTEAISGEPSKKQWARIKERIAEVDGQSVAGQVWIWPTYRPPQFYTYPQFTSTTCGNFQGSSGAVTIDVQSGMYALGVSDAQDVTAGTF